MLLKFAALALLALVQLQGFDATANPKTVCYYESWVHWRKGDGKIELEELGKFALKIERILTPENPNRPHRLHTLCLLLHGH